MSREICPFCGLHPYEYVDIGVGMQPIAVNCCPYGELYFVNGYSMKEILRMELEYMVEMAKRNPVRYYPTEEKLDALF